MIATTLGALVQAEPALQPICQLKLTARSAYHVKKLVWIVAQETKHFHAERDRYITELGTATDAGGFELKPDNEAFPTFVAQLNELAAVEVTIPWGPITLAMLGDAQVSAVELSALGPLLADCPIEEAG